MSTGPGRRRAATRSPRTGRRPGTSGTREAILEAARTLFAARGYDATTLRGVAAEAGVDSALVVHFFKNKVGLFIAAMDWPFDPEQAADEVTAAGAEHVGERAVRLFVEVWDREGDRNAILSLVQSAMGDPAAAELLRGFMQRQLFEAALGRLDVDEPQLRAQLVSSQLLGLGLARYVLRFEPLASLPARRVIQAVGRQIQQYVTGPLP